MREYNEIEQLVRKGQLRDYLGKRLSQDVLGAYEETFGGVQDLSTERDQLGVIVNKLAWANQEKQNVFWRSLNAHTPQRKNGIWKQIQKWLKR